MGHAVAFDSGVTVEGSVFGTREIPKGALVRCAAPG